MKCLKALLFLPASALAANTATCILDKMPGVQNDATAQAIFQVCVREYGSFDSVEPGSGRGWFSYDSGAECTASKGKDTSSQRGGVMIRAACSKLYDKPAPSIFDDLVPFKGKLGGEK